MAVAKKPKRGQQIGGYPGYVMIVKLVREKNGIGKVTVTIRDESAGAQAEWPDKETNPKYEIRYVEIERPLETHPIYNKTGDKSMKSEVTLDATYMDSDLREKCESVFGEAIRTLTIGTLIQTMKNATPADRAALEKIVKAGETSVYDLVAGFFQKWDAGVESYSVFAPVARKTSESMKSVAKKPPGKIETPPGFTDLPSGYQWLKVTADSTRTGRFGRCENVEEWRGAEQIDTDLYSK